MILYVIRNVSDLVAIATHIEHIYWLIRAIHWNVLEILVLLGEVEVVILVGLGALLLAWLLLLRLCVFLLLGTLSDWLSQLFVLDDSLAYLWASWLSVIIFLLDFLQLLLDSSPWLLLYWFSLFLDFDIFFLSEGFGLGHPWHEWIKRRTSLTSGLFLRDEDLLNGVALALLVPHFLQDSPESLRLAFLELKGAWKRFLGEKRVLACLRIESLLVFLSTLLCLLSWWLLQSLVFLKLWPCINLILLLLLLSSLDRAVCY